MGYSYETAWGMGTSSSPSTSKEIDVAWAAGLFEGEGCWNAYVRSSGKVQMQARLGMTDSDIVERFAAVVGFGKIHESHSGRVQDKPVWTWCIYEAEKVRSLVALFLPYMGDRRRAQAVEMLRLGADIESHKAKRTHCPQGHPYSGDNLMLEPIERAGKAYTARRCRTCRRDQHRQRKEANHG